MTDLEKLLEAVGEMRTQRNRRNKSLKFVRAARKGHYADKKKADDIAHFRWKELNMAVDKVIKLANSIQAAREIVPVIEVDLSSTERQLVEAMRKGTTEECLNCGGSGEVEFYGVSGCPQTEQCFVCYGRGVVQL